MKALALMLCVALSGVAHAADPSPLPSDAPTVPVKTAAPMAPSVVEIRVGDAVPFDGVLTEAGEYEQQAKGVAALTAERDAMSKRLPLLGVVILAAACIAVGTGAGAAAVYFSQPKVKP